MSPAKGQAAGNEFIEFIGFDDAISGLEAAGAEVTLIYAAVPDVIEDFAGLGYVGLQQGVAAYLDATDPDGPIGSIADVVAFNETDLARYAPYGQSGLEAAAGLPDVSREDIEAAGEELRQQMRAYLDGLRAEYELDVIASRDNRLSSAYAVAGYPAVAVPAGTSDASGGPLGLTFVGEHLQDAAVLGYAYAFEQATLLREPPLD